MPYISQKDRCSCHVNCIPPDNAGQLNYMVTDLVDLFLRNKCSESEHKMRYAYINEAIGALECAKLELYRRIAAQHEDVKKKENGDVYRCLSYVDNS